ncbi:MAG: asparagine synthase (glutamine-hydrolyzing) [Fimbriimonadaceae bacterium]
MCGIAGYISANRDGKGEKLVHAIVESQIHRGPDFQAVVPLKTEKGEVVLGHNRLSIIDLSAAANQPQYDESGQISIVLNGEFYNYIEIRAELEALGHTFRTQSDVEVLIQAYKEWGHECLSRVNGMFAFALCDLRNNTVWLVRDRFGVKPLFYRANGSELAWASSGRVIAEQYGLKPNLKYVYKGVTSWNFDDSSEDSPYEGLTNLPGGHQVLIEIESGRLKISKCRWYDLDSRATALREEISTLSDQAIAERLAETFASSCEIRMRADVPVAVALSGGLDSGTVASWVAKDHPEVKGFCFGDPNDAKTEGPMARLLADRAGIDITFIKPDMQTMIDGFGKSLEAQDAPFVSFAQVAQYLVAKQVAAEGFKVLLGGQGGDEGFMGYRKYFLFALKEMIAQKRFTEAASLGANLIPVFWAERASMGNYWRHRKRFQGQN